MKNNNNSVQSNMSSSSSSVSCSPASSSTSSPVHPPGDHYPVSPLSGLQSSDLNNINSDNDHCKS